MDNTLQGQKNPQFFFLDEAASALAAENERKILDNLNEFFRGRRLVVIAHRLIRAKNTDYGTKQWQG